MTTAAAQPHEAILSRAVRRPRAGALDRAIAAVIAAACIAVLATAAWLTPSPSGSGTHRQIGMLPCGWVVAFDKPCPTCGMTTSFAHAANLDLLAAIRAQPMGAFLAVVTAVVFWCALHVCLTGSRLGAVAIRFLTPRVGWILLGMLAAAWAYKVYTWQSPQLL